MAWHDNRSDHQHGWGQSNWHKVDGQWEEVPLSSYAGGGPSSSSAGPANISRHDAAWDAHREVKNRYTSRGKKTPAPPQDDNLDAKDVDIDGPGEDDFDKELIERITELSALREIPNLSGRDKETLPSHDDVPTCVGLVKNNYDEQARVMTTRANRNSEYKIEMPPVEALVATINRCAIEDPLYLPRLKSFFVDPDKAFDSLLGIWRSHDKKPLIDADQGQELMVHRYLSLKKEKGEECSLPKNCERIAKIALPAEGIPQNLVAWRDQKWLIRDEWGTPDGESLYVGHIKNAGKWGGVYLGTAFEVA